MSTTIDEKVVSMKFDNQQFERNISSTLISLEKLKEKLNFTGASKGFENIDSAVKKVDMTGLSNAVETVRTRFSALEIMGITALANITNSAVNAGKRIASALMIDPIKTGLSEYETQINSVQTILANTESKGSTLTDVNKALDELNTYADKTIYNFTEMTRNIGTFTAAGVDLDTSVKSIQGIANLAAISGSTSQQASTAMYQLSQALAAGKVQLMDWNSVVNAGMGGEVFQNALKRTATVMGTNVDAMIKKYGSFRESLTKGEWLTADVLTETLNQFTMAAEEGTKEWEAYKASLKEKGYTEEQAVAILKMANTATNAATKVKTFSQLWDTLKESAQSGWTQTWEILIGDFEEAQDLLTKISDTIGGMLTSSAEARNELLSTGLQTGWKQFLDKGIANEEEYIDIVKSVAKEHGVSIDEMIDKSGSFKDTLKDGWLSADMLSESVIKYADKLKGMSDEELKAAGYTRDHVIELEKLEEGVKNGSISLEEFAEKMARPSGRENLIEALWNSFEGLMSVITPIKEAFREIFPRATGEQLYALTVSIKEFTSHLKLSETQSERLKSTFKGLFAIIDIFATILFKVVSGVVKITGALLGFGDGVLAATGTFGDFLSNIRDSIKEVDILGKGIDAVTNFLLNVITSIKEFGTSVKDSFGSPNFDGFTGFLLKLWETVINIGSKIVEIFTSIGSTITDIFNSGSFTNIFNSGMFAAIVAAIYKFVNSVSGPFDSLSDVVEGAGGIFENLTGTLDDVRGCFTAYQDQLKAGTLMKIASAIAILAAALFVLSTIDSEEMGKSLGAITVLFIELQASLALFSGAKSSILGASKSIALMIGMSTAIVILASALKIISSIDTDSIVRGLVAVGALMAELLLFLKFAKFDKGITRASIGITILSSAMLILAKAVESFGAMSWEEIGKGLSAIGGLLLEIAAFTNLTGKASNVISTSIGIVILATAMKIFASAIKDFSTMSWIDIGKGLVGIAGALISVSAALRLLPNNMLVIGIGLSMVAAALMGLSKSVISFSSMSWEEIGKGLAGLAGALLALAIALNIMPKNIIMMGVGLIVIAEAMGILATSLNSFGGMSWEEIGKGLAAMAGSLLTLAVALKLMNGSVTGSAALIIAAGALAILAPVLTNLGSMSWESIAKGLVALAGAFAVVGIAGALLTPLVPSILSLSAAFALFGVSILGIGAGMALLGVGFTVLATSAAAGATALVAALTIITTGVASLIPELISILGDAIAGLCTVIIECSPMIVDAFFTLLMEALNALVTYTPQIVDALLQLLIGILESLSDNLPTLITAAVEVIMSLFQGIVDALMNIDTETLLQGIVAVGLLAGLIAALSAIVPLIPGAMAGVLGMGVIVAELALVLAAIGAFAQIPGLSWLIGEGGNFLQTIGTAIGKFVGGIVGGFGEGVTSSLPQIGSNLSSFMTNLQPFIDGAKGVNAEMLEGVNMLAKTILVLTAADLINGITSWLTGGTSLVDFANQLIPFGEGMKKYADSVTGIDASAVTNSAIAAQALSELANNLPNSGGLVSWFTGDNEISDFAGQLVPLGEGVKKYSDAVVGINMEAVNSSVMAVKSLVGVINNLSNIETTGVGSFAYAITTLGNVSVENFINAFEGSHSRLRSIGVGMIQSVIDGINTKKSSLTNAASSLVDSMIKGVSSKKIALTTSMTTLLTSVLTVINTKGPSFNKAGVKLINEFASGISKNDKKVTSAVKDILKDAADKLDDYKDDFYDAGEDLVKGFANGISENTFRAEAKARAMAKAALEAAEDELGIESPSKAFAEVGKYSNEGLAEGLIDNAYLSEEAARDLGDSLIVNISEGIDKNTTAEEAASKKAQNITNAFQKEFDEIELDVSTADLEYELWSKFAGDDATQAEMLKKELDLLNTKLEKQKERVNLAQNEYQMMLKTFGEDSKNTQEAYNKLLQEQIKMVELSNSIVEKQGNVGADQKEALLEYSRLIRENYDKLIEAGLSAKEINDWAIFKSGYKGSIRFGLEVEIPEDASKEVKANSEELALEGAEALMNYKIDWYESGKQLSEGFVGGIASSETEAISAGISLAEAALNGVTEKLDIHSPSRVMYKTGRFAGEGFVSALKEYANVCYNVASEVGESAKEGLRNAVARIADSIDGDMDLNPTIRPVLDLSEIQNGSNQLDSLFANRTLMLSQMNADITGRSDELNSLVSKLASLNESNDSRIVDAIANLRSEFGTLKEAIANMSIRLDSGALVGGITNQMDVSLGKVAMHKGRGN